MNVLSRRQAVIAMSTAAAGAVMAPRALGLARSRPPAAPWRGALGLDAALGDLQLPPLPYPENALEPAIDAETMQIHHDRHHKAYLDNANKALAGTPWADKPAEEILTSLAELPDDKRSAVRNNLGGHINHSMFWLWMAPAGKGGGDAPTGPVADAINAAFGSFDQPGGFKEKFAAAAAGRFGSGWAWLVAKGGKLSIVSTANQDNPLMGEAVAGCSGTPILGLDVWEHAYYLKYRNKRPDYVTAWWSVVNWPRVAELYSSSH